MDGFVQTRSANRHGSTRFTPGNPRIHWRQARYFQPPTTLHVPLHAAIMSRRLNDMTIKKTFITVTVAALAGLAMGGLFGFGAGKITPDFFRHIIPWQDVEPVGFATFSGATAGVLLGGGLGCFA